MGSLAMRCSWVMCACRQTIQMPLTVMTQSSLTLSEGMLFRWSCNFFAVVSHSLGYMISQSSCKYFHMNPGCLEILFCATHQKKVLVIDWLIESFLSVSCSYDFTPLDSSAVYVLSSMARQRRASLSSGGAVSPDCDKLERSSSPHSSSSKSNRSHNSGIASGATPTKCKRPMNAFMLFAKKYRVEYTQMYPGKDNRCENVTEIQYTYWYSQLQHCA